MRKLLQILSWIRHPKLTRLITSALSVGTCICARVGRFDLIKGGDKMIGKQYFKVEIFVRKEDLQSTVDFLIECNSSRRIQNLFDAVVLQNIAANKKVPSIQVQVDGPEQVTKLVKWLSARKNYGYTVWLSKEFDFMAVRRCNLFSQATEIVSNIIEKLEEDEDDFKSNRNVKTCGNEETQPRTRRARKARTEDEEASSEDSSR